MRAGLTMLPGILTRLIDVKAVMSVLQGRDPKAARDQRRDQAANEGRLAGTAPARKPYNTHRQIGVGSVALDMKDRTSLGNAGLRLPEQAGDAGDRDDVQGARERLMTKAHAGKIVRFEHPGAGRRRAKMTPKGREVQPGAKDEIATLLADRPRSREFLIEHLHLIQDTYKQISAAHLAALADEMRLAYAEVFETATFYAHFDVVKEDEPPLAPLVICVCDSVTCAMFGAERLLKELQALPDANGVNAKARVVRAPCVGLCDQAPVVEVGHHFLHNADQTSVQKAIERDDTHPHIPDDYIDYDAYVAAGGYRLLSQIRSGEMDVETVLSSLMTRACVAWAEPDFPPPANGARSAASPALG